MKKLKKTHEQIVQELSEKGKLQKLLAESINRDCQYDFVDIDYDSSGNCDAYGCHEEGICRCSKITNTKIKSIKATKFVREVIDKELPEQLFYNKAILRYCFERLLFQLARNPDSWSVNISGGYYGEEIESVKLDSYEASQLIVKLSDMVEISTRQQVFTVLTEEYGYILPALENVKEFSVESLDPNKIRAQNYRTQYIKKTEQKFIEQYVDHPFPCGIVLLDNGIYGQPIYRLIDGFHRLEANKDCQQIEMIVGKIDEK